MALILGWAQAPEGTLGCAQPSEQHDPRPPLPVMDVSLPRGARNRGSCLALPVQGGRADRVIPVAGRGREPTDALIEREGEEISLAPVVPPHAGLPGGRGRAAN